jgi:hypothetical protein
VSNTGTDVLQIGGIGASGDFTESNTCGDQLAAGAQCTISVQFAPTAAGTRTGTVTIADDLGSQVVAICGTGNSPQISLDPATLSFGSYRKGFTSPAQTVTLTNSGTAPLAIAGIVAEGDFSATNDCGTSLAAGAHCSLNVTFTPTARGQRTGALLIETGSDPATVTVSVTTAGRALALPVPSSPVPPAGTPRLWALGLLGFLLLGGWMWMPSRRRRRVTVTALAGMALLLVLAGCGGGPSPSIASNETVPSGDIHDRRAGLFVCRTLSSPPRRLSRRIAVAAAAARC